MPNEYESPEKSWADILHKRGVPGYGEPSEESQKLFEYPNDVQHSQNTKPSALDQTIREMQIRLPRVPLLRKEEEVMKETCPKNDSEKESETGRAFRGAIINFVNTHSRTLLDASVNLTAAMNAGNSSSQAIVLSPSEIYFSNMIHAFRKVGLYAKSIGSIRNIMNNSNTSEHHFYDISTFPLNQKTLGHKISLAHMSFRLLEIQWNSLPS